ncbi:MAG: discoidin domain-containing protein [Planctomycetota bacterium]
MLRHEIFDKQFSIIAIALAITMFVGIESAFTAQELKVGFIPGRGSDAALEDQAFKLAQIEFEKIETGDYNLDRLLEFDVIGVGVTAYDGNEDLKANFEVLKEYVEKSGYLVTLDFQQDSSWNQNFLPHPITLFDPDLDDDVGVVLADHDIFKKPNIITEKHFGVGIWGGGDFMADGPHEVKPPWEPLVTDKQNNWPLVAVAPAGKGYVVFNSLQILQSLGNLGNNEVVQVLQNFLFWRGLRVLPFNARDPYPDNEAEDVPRDVVLSWEPGEFAAPTNGHKVYFGENFNDVNDAVGGVAQTATSYTPPQRLDFGKTYYWRIDEVNAPPVSHIEYKGEVWSFTTELFAYPIDGNDITATASSAHQGDMGPENTINGSGLDDNDLHSSEETDMWLSSTEPLAGWIEYEFDKVHKLHQMSVWNSNQTVEPLLGFGLKDVTIEYSTNGTEYTTLGTTHEFGRAPGAGGYAHNTTIDFGSALAKYVRLTANSNWGGFMPQYGLSEVRFFHIPMHARAPYPDSGATEVDVDVVLGWTSGREAVTHDVYFSADEQAVVDGTAPFTTVTEPSYDPLSLNLGSTYYWRVDEANEAETPATWQGDLWDFTIQEYFVVDDFESYNDLDTTDLESNRIFLTWIDGYDIPTNGCLVGYEVPPFCEQTIVHGGKQSMPLAYSNTGGAAYSEAERTFAVAQNWTQAGAATLVLYFHGTEGNTGQLYVKVNGSKVVYDGDAGDIAKVEWKQWNIDLASLGIDLQNVTNLVIGIDGNGAGGTLYFDDIRLYPLP